MTTVNIHEAEANLKNLVERAAQGEPFLISREGRPSLQITVTETGLLASDVSRRIGFLQGGTIVATRQKYPGTGCRRALRQ